MPAVNQLAFVHFPRVALTQPCPAIVDFPAIERIVDGLLVCSAARRVSAKKALNLFETTEKANTLKVTGEEPDWNGGSFGKEKLGGKTLGEWLAPFLS